jgi:hypothetical protein
LHLEPRETPLSTKESGLADEREERNKKVKTQKRLIFVKKAELNVI